MNTDARLSGRWIGPLLGVVLIVGACSSGPTDPDPASSGDSGPLALVDNAADATLDGQVDSPVAGEVDSAVDSETGAGFGLEQLDDIDELPTMALTPEEFEELRSDEEGRSVVLSEMEAQGLGPDEAECFLDNVSADLFITFSGGEMPDEEQFGELMELLVLCDVSLMSGG